MQQSVSDSESAPNTLQSATKRFLVTYRCIAKRYKALCNARLMQLVPGKTAGPDKLKPLLPKELRVEIAPIIKVILKKKKKKKKKKKQT